MDDDHRFAWIDWRPEGDDDRAALDGIFTDLGAPGGVGFDHVLKIHGPMPRTLSTHLDFYRSIMRDRGPLDRVEREIVGVVVSQSNDCRY